MTRIIVTLDSGKQIDSSYYMNLATKKISPLDAIDLITRLGYVREEFGSRYYPLHRIRNFEVIN